MKQVDPVTFINRAIKKNESGKPFELAPVQVGVLTLLYQYLDSCTTFVYSTIKKSGKTLIQGLFLLWWALTHDYDEIILAANDFDQSQGRVFKGMAGLIRHNTELKR